ncbi:MAG: phage protease, partial [Myxococcota bacterium]
AELAKAAFADHATDTPIDYEHQTLGGSYASPNGQAPAAGWIKAIEAEPGVGLIASIEWTEQAKQMLAAKEYRYLSPVALIRKRDRKLRIAGTHGDRETSVEREREHDGRTRECRSVPDQHENPGPDHRAEPEHARAHDAEAALQRNRFLDTSVVIGRHGIEVARRRRRDVPSE